MLQVISNILLKPAIPAKRIDSRAKSLESQYPTSLRRISMMQVLHRR